MPRVDTVAFIHGYGGHAGPCHRLGHTLNAAGNELVALDQIGNGRVRPDFD